MKKNENSYYDKFLVLENIFHTFSSKFFTRGPPGASKVFLRNSVMGVFISFLLI